MKGLKTILVGMTITIAGGFIVASPDMESNFGLIIMLGGVVVAICGLRQ